MPRIIRDGYFYRAINTATGFKSSLFTSASQAGAIIVRNYGRDAYWAAIEDFKATRGMN
jgi:hypothetical protein